MPATHSAPPRASHFGWPSLAMLGLSMLALASGITLAGEPTGQSSSTIPSDPLHGARQLVLVTTGGWDDNQGRLRRFERSSDSAPWHGVATFDVSIGRKGSAWGTGLHAADGEGDGPRKREGDGRSPAGAFALGTAFGYAEAVDSGLPYQPMQASNWCMDVADSPLYNRIVDAREVGAAAVAGSTEPMRLDLHKDGDPRYRLGFVIGHNPGNVPQRGSCIFAHLWRTPGEPTAGCTAMDDADMRAMLAWLDPAKQPRFVLLPRAEHARLAKAWQLPAAMDTDTGTNTTEPAR